MFVVRTLHNVIGLALMAISLLIIIKGPINGNIEVGQVIKRLSSERQFQGGINALNWHCIWIGLKDKVVDFALGDFVEFVIDGLVDFPHYLRLEYVDDSIDEPVWDPMEACMDVK